jgi:peptidyl-prolyl cis-trans isomerase B (cyclophilin B)
MKKIKYIVLMLITLSLLTGCNSKINTLNINFDIDGNTSEDFNYTSDYPEVAMYLEGYGAIVMELYPDIAPNTVNNFIALVKSGFYDNNSFHRLVPGFVLQGGDPNGDGTGGPGYHIQGEFTNNNFTNNLKHTKGIISMARSTLPNSAGSQFFICLDNATNLDGDYAAFGKVIQGMDIIDSIAANAKVSNKTTGKLVNNIIIKKALVNTKGMEYPEPVKN